MYGAPPVLVVVSRLAGTLAPALTGRGGWKLQGNDKPNDRGSRFSTSAKFKFPKW